MSLLFKINYLIAKEEVFIALDNKTSHLKGLVHSGSFATHDHLSTKMLLLQLTTLRG